MADSQYVYAVARIRSLEMSLFSASTIEQLMSCKTVDDCLSFLSEKGWGDHDVSQNADALLARENEKTWETIKELKVDMSVFDVLSYPNTFHNLKAAIKEVCTEQVSARIYYNNCPLSGAELVDIVKEKNFSLLPSYMAEAASEAYETLLHTRDGQMCDVIIDKATLEALIAAGKASKDELVQLYAEATVAVANIKMAVRSQKTGKSLDFMKRAFVKCDSLDVDALAQAALGGFDVLCDYLTEIGYDETAEKLKNSSSAFECWCDNRIIRILQPQKHNPFSAGPVFAYILARENEIKTVRIILTGKQNGLPDDFINERIREMYV